MSGKLFLPTVAPKFMSLDALTALLWCNIDCRIFRYSECEVLFPAVSHLLPENLRFLISCPLTCQNLTSRHLALLTCYQFSPGLILIRCPLCPSFLPTHIFYIKIRVRSNQVCEYLLFLLALGFTITVIHPPTLSVHLLSRRRGVFLFDIRLVRPLPSFIDLKWLKQMFSYCMDTVSLIWFWFYFSRGRAKNIYACTVGFEL